MRVLEEEGDDYSKVVNNKQECWTLCQETHQLADKSLWCDRCAFQSLSPGFGRCSLVANEPDEEVVEDMEVAEPPAQAAQGAEPPSAEAAEGAEPPSAQEAEGADQGAEVAEPRRALPKKTETMHKKGISGTGRGISKHRPRETKKHKGTSKQGFSKGISKHRYLRLSPSLRLSPQAPDYYTPSSWLETDPAMAVEGGPLAADAAPLKEEALAARMARMAPPLPDEEQSAAQKQVGAGAVARPSLRGTAHADKVAAEVVEEMAAEEIADTESQVVDGLSTLPSREHIVDIQKAAGPEKATEALAAYMLERVR